MVSKMIELFSKNLCVGDIELLYRLHCIAIRKYRYIAGRNILHCLLP